MLDPDGRAAPAEAEVAANRAAMIRGVRWTGLAQGLTALLQIGVVVVLARTLLPADFGLLAMASAVIAIVGAVQTLGTHGPLIQREQISPLLVDTVFVLNLVLAFVLMALLMATAPLFADLYRTPEVAPLIQAISVALVLYALSGVPGALLARRMHFGAIALTDTVGAVLFAAVAVGLAWAGYGVWSLVVAMLASSTVEAAVIMVAARYRPRWQFSGRELRSIAGFAANMTGVNVVNLALRNADSLIIGRWLGPGALGLFGMATRFTRQPVEMFVSAVLGPVLFPAYSRMQHDDVLTANTMRRALAGAAFLMFPLLGGIAAISRPFADGILGPEWGSVAVLILLMAPIGMMRTLVSTVTGLFLARDRTRLLFLLRLAAGVLLICAYLGGVRIGLIAVVLAMLAAEAVITWVELIICARIVGMRMRRLLAGTLSPLLAATIMAVAVYGLDRFLHGQGWNDLAILGLAIPLGGVIYVALGLRQQALVDLIDLLPEGLAQSLRAILLRWVRHPALV